MSTATPDLESDLADLESAEDFLDYFGVAYDPKIVHVNRLHILQRFHDYLTARKGAAAPAYADYSDCLMLAYNDFVHSDAITEKVFSVLKRASGIATVPVTAIGRTRH
jgi:nitrogenase-stabilizing/protective protein